ncbi:MAG: Hsp20/alpha crystallin family protein [Thermodesulfobacteriota bacterium]
MFELLPVNRIPELFARPRTSLFDRFFEGFGMPSLIGEESVLTPALDVSETEKEYRIKAEIPGLSKEDISVTLDEGVLTVSGEKKAEHEEKGENYHVRERSYGYFSRSLRLPEAIEVEKVDATYRDGVLHVVIPKTEGGGAKKIAVS